MRSAGKLIFLCAVLAPSAAVAAQRMITVDDLVAIRDIQAMSVSPDGRFVAYLLQTANSGTNRYSLDWFVAPIAPRSSPVRVSDGGEFNLWTYSLGLRNGFLERPVLRWSHDSAWITFTRKEGSTVQVWRAARDGSRSEQLTHNAASVVDFDWSSDDREIYFTVGRDPAVVSERDRIEGLVGYHIQEPLPVPGYGTVPAWPPCDQDKWHLPGDPSRECSDTQWVYEIASARERAPTAPEEQSIRQALVRSGTDAASEAGSSATSPDGRQIAKLANPNPGLFRGPRPPHQVTVSSTAGSGRVLRCPAKECCGQHLESLWWSPTGQEVVFLAHDGEGYATTSLYAWTPGAGRVRTIFRSDEFAYGAVDSWGGGCQQTHRLLICSREGWTRPAQIVAIDITSGSQYVVVDPNSTFEGIRFTRVDKLAWETGCGTLTIGHLVYPEGFVPGRAFPLVVVQYASRGFLRGATGDEQPIHVYAANGIGVLSTNLPENETVSATSADLDELIEKDADYGVLGHCGVKSIQNILDRLTTDGLVDSSRIGISGLSSGATVTDEALATSNRFAAASAAYSNSGQFSYYLLPASLRTDLRHVMGGTPFDDKLGRWRAESLGTNAARIATPYLLQVADREYLDTLQNYIDLTDAGKAVDLYVFPDEYHVKWQPAHRLAVYRRNLQWFEFWLRGVEEPVPVDAGQYRRWQVMRERLRTQRSPEPGG